MKRLLDVVCSFAVLMLLSPVLLLLFAASFVALGWPIFFLQSRPGLNGNVFRIIKLRTMTQERGKNGELLPDAERMTTYGNFLRSTSLDELPELVNVLKGDMSLVGPRPLLVRYLERYSPEQARRHEVRPGITGWAQVKGRNALSWEDRFSLDVWYVENRSFWLDLKIIFMTLGMVLSRKGISAAGEATMPEFRGSTTDNHE